MVKRGLKTGTITEVKKGRVLTVYKVAFKTDEPTYYLSSELVKVPAVKTARKILRRGGDKDA